MKPFVLPLLAGLILAAPDGAFAQSLSPMKDEVATSLAHAGIRLTVGNPGARRTRFSISAHEVNWAPLAGARASRPVFAIIGGEQTSVLVTVPMNGLPERQFRVCVTSAPVMFAGPASGQGVRGQVCGRYHARARQR